ncbi:transglutaminaseTgpA domain-containing protein, partial [Psychrobacter sp. T6-1]
RRLSDQASYYWQKDIVGYDQDSQASSLLKWFNITSVMQQVMWMAAIAISIMSIIIFMIWQRRRKHWHPADQPLIKLSQRLSKSDKAFARDDNEGQLAWLERLANHKDNSGNNKKLPVDLTQIMQNYRQLRYGRISTLAIKDDRYKQALRAFKKQVKTLF